MEVGEGSRIGGRWSSLIRLKIFVASILQCFMSMFQQSLFDLTYMTPSRASEFCLFINIYIQWTYLRSVTENSFWFSVLAQHWSDF